VPIAFPAPIAAQLTFDQDKAASVETVYERADKNALIALSTNVLTGLLLLTLFNNAQLTNSSKR